MKPRPISALVGMVPADWQPRYTRRRISAETYMTGLLARIEAGGLRDEAGCLLWSGGRSAAGYGTIGAFGKLQYVHRLAYQMYVGPIPDGLTIDHVRARGCLNRHCFEPTHLEPVTHAENVRRSEKSTRTHCKRAGHPLVGDNLYIHPTTGGRVCLECKRLREQIAKGAAA